MGEQLEMDRGISVASALLILLAVLALPSGRGDHTQRFVLFGSSHGRNATASLKSMNLLAVLGSDALDFSGTEMDGGKAEVRANALLGKVDIRVPKHWDVRVDGVPVLGKYVDRTEHPQPGNPVLVVKGNAVLGQVCVRN